MNDGLSYLRFSEKNMSCGIASQYDDGLLKLPSEGCTIGIAYIDSSSMLLNSNSTMERFVQLGLFPYTPTIRQITRLLSRGLFKPIAPILSYASDLLKSLRQYTSLGIQIRTGGSLSNDADVTVFFSEATLPRVYQLVKDVVNNENLTNVIIFLSTDSNRVIYQSKFHFAFPIVTADKYKIGHSNSLRGRVSTSAIERALVDVYVLSNCDFLFTTSTSSFGDLASDLSHSEKKFTLYFQN